jgi:hypothetical protein
MFRNTSGLRRGGGRKPGVPNRATREARAFLQGLLAKAFTSKFEENLVREIEELTVDPRLLKLVVDLAYGRAPVAMDFTARGRSLEEIVAGVVHDDIEDETN